MTEQELDQIAELVVQKLIAHLIKYGNAVSSYPLFRKSVYPSTAPLWAEPMQQEYGS